MKGGRDTKAKIVCNGCYVKDDAIFYRSEGIYGRIDWCYACVKARLGGWEPEIVCLPIDVGFIDHVESRRRKRQPAEQLSFIAA